MSVFVRRHVKREGATFSARSFAMLVALILWRRSARLGNYLFRPSAESAYIGGCIGKQNVPHLGLFLKDKGTDREIVNLHPLLMEGRGPAAFRHLQQREPLGASEAVRLLERR
jgi:hypothetical protein